MLAHTPEVQAALYHEVTSVLRDGEDIVPATLANTPYVKACLKETFRSVNKRICLAANDGLIPI